MTGLMRVAFRRGAAAVTPQQDVRLGTRFAFAAVAVFLIAVPFSLLVVLVLAKNQTLARLDLRVATNLHALLLHRPVLADAMIVVGRITEPWVLRALAAIIAIVLWHRGRRRVAAWLVVTMAVGGTIGVLLKVIIARARPHFTDPVTVAGGYSFPSGHALNSVLFVSCLLVLVLPAASGVPRVVAWAAGIGLVLLVGVDRIGLGVHYLSDVLAGWVVALATVAATVAAFETWRREQGMPPASTETGLDEEEPS
jgi:membrane-associated phospholipid phosphatase